MDVRRVIEATIDGGIDTPSPTGQKTEALDALIPNTVQIGNHHTVLFTPTDKSLIIMYMMIGLTELVVASSGMTQEAIWTALISRSIRNLKKDGLLK